MFQIDEYLIVDAVAPFREQFGVRKGKDPISGGQQRSLYEHPGVQVTQAPPVKHERQTKQVLNEG